MKSIALLGSTGSVGRQAVGVVLAHPHRFRIRALSAGYDIERFEEQLSVLNPDVASVAEARDASVLQKKFPDIAVFWGEEGLAAVASHPDADIVLNALVGTLGLQPTVTAVEHGKHVALANKETLVAAGSLVMDKVHEKGVALLPVDSEHSAIFQCLQNQQLPKRLLLTASGGPFRGYTKEQLRSVTLEQALAHPKWSMGKKITIDSATMMNKGLEIIEAHFLFDIPEHEIDVVVHPESLLHSAVVFEDGSVIGQLGWPDMKVPIAFALSYPERLPDIVEPLDFVRAGALSFEEPDCEVFRCLALAREALRAGDSFPATLNASNEVAVEAFLSGAIPFHRIASVVEKVLQAHNPTVARSIEDVLSIDEAARRQARSFIQKQR